MSDEKIAEYLRSARDYCAPHPGLSKTQLLFEMERARRTLDYIIGSLSPKDTPPQSADSESAPAPSSISSCNLEYELGTD